MKKILIFTIVMIFAGCSFVDAKGFVAANLKCEYTTTPLGLDIVSPRLMWNIDASQRDFKQGACRVFVSSSKQLADQRVGDVFDSGRIDSNETMVVCRSKKPLESYKRYYWGVEIWDVNGVRGSRGDISWFEMGKIEGERWSAKWITDTASMDYKPAPMFRREFVASKKISSARTYICGLGYYELFLNGERVGDHLLDPGFTDFAKRNLYVTYDVTDMVRKGKNCIGVVLGNGWYNEQAKAVWNFHLAPWRSRPRLICETHIVYDDGTKKVVSSDQTWRTATGALQYDNLYTGVVYDACMEYKGWLDVGFDDSKWMAVTLTDQPAPILEAQKMDAIGVSKVIKPISMRRISDRVVVYDMGVNFAGVCRLKVKGNRGTVITLRHGEILDSNGVVDQRNIAMHLRPASDSEVIQLDKYILKGEGVETFTPKFTYHGFQYVEVVSSEPISLDLNSLSGIVMHSDVAPIGSFESSNELINQIHDISKRSYLSNLFGIPTDCPHREKNGWMADGYMVQEAGMLGYDSRNIYAKWVKDMKDAQQSDGNIHGIVPTSWNWDSNWAGPMWDAAIFMVPYQLYQYYGDVETIREIYPTAKRYLEYLKTTEKENGTIDHGLGDWLFYKAQTPIDFMGTSIYYWDNLRMAQFAQLIGNECDARQYLDKAKKLKEIINREFFDADKISYANGTQLSYALPLYVGVVDEQYRERLVANLARCVAENDYSLDFGFIGSLVVPIVLSDYGYADVVYRMVTKTTLPSWGYWIKETGATSLYETWDINRNIGDASRNHPSMGAISAWFYKSLGGINRDPKSVGFYDIVIKPSFPEGLEWVNCSYQSQQGKIGSSWRRRGNIVILDVEIPANTSATIELPSADVICKIKSLKGESSIFKVGSGSYRFTIKL